MNGVRGRGFSAAESLFLGEGSGKDWKHLSARKPSPSTDTRQTDIFCIAFYRPLTNIKHQSLRGGLSINGKLAHAMNDGTDKVNVEDGIDIDQMEDDSNGQETEATQPSHVEKERHASVSADF
jgi:hypothetical protein